MDRKRCRPPVIIDRVLEDRAIVRDLVARGGPYFTVQRYLANLDEMSTLSDAGKRGKPDAPMIIAPWFRGDWAYGAPKLAGLEPFFENPCFIEAARTLVGGAIVVPHVVYVNLNPPMPQLDPGHTDVPAFRGIDRTSYPVWLLVAMMRSGLFDRYYVDLATAVAWYYEGDGGGFRYWPDGPDARPIDRPCIDNSAVVGDNDRMFHCVLDIGAEKRLVRGLTLESTFALEADTYVIRESGDVLARYPFEAVRLSVSWKAMVFADEAAHATYTEHTDDLTRADVERIFLDDLGRRGLDTTPPIDLLTDRRFIRLLNETYGFSPTVFG